MDKIFFTRRASIGRTVVIGVAACVGLLLLRISGKRTLTRMNAFGLVVTVALGSTLATVLLSKSVALANGLTAFALQFLITWPSVRSRAVGRLVKADPMLLVHQGTFLHAAMRTERLTERELLAAQRQHGLASVDKAAAVVLENNGQLSVLQQTTTGPDSALRDAIARLFPKNLGDAAAPDKRARLFAQANDLTWVPMSARKNGHRRLGARGNPGAFVCQLRSHGPRPSAAIGTAAVRTRAADRLPTLSLQVSYIRQAADPTLTTDYERSQVHGRATEVEELLSSEQ